MSQFVIKILAGVSSPCLLDCLCFNLGSIFAIIKGSVTCHGNMVKNANCPKDQYMVVKTASYRGLPDTKTCGLSDDYSCEVDVTCLVKKQCDGQHECSITVDNNLFSDDLCPGLTKYLYFEYRCGAKKTVQGVCGISFSYLFFIF